MGIQSRLEENAGIMLCVRFALGLATRTSRQTVHRSIVDQKHRAVILCCKKHPGRFSAPGMLTIPLKLLAPQELTTA